MTGPVCEALQVFIYLFSHKHMTDVAILICISLACRFGGLELPEPAFTNVLSCRPEAVLACGPPRSAATLIAPDGRSKKLNPLLLRYMLPL